MDAEIKAKWCAALRSGQYRQAQGMLRLDGAFCCLGVLCDINGTGKWTETGCFDYPGDLVETVLPEPMKKRFGIDGAAEQQLMEMNDGDDSFGAIANWIEECL